MICLEVGPGTGGRYRFSPVAPVSCDPIVFLDTEPPRGRAKYVGEWVVGDAEMMPFRSTAFDMVYASHVIEHLENPELFLYNMYRICRPGCSAVVRTPNFLSRNARGDPDHRHVFTVFKLWRAARLAGFKVYISGCEAGTLLPRQLARLLTILFALLSDTIEVVLRREA